MLVEETAIKPEQVCLLDCASPPITINKYVKIWLWHLWDKYSNLSI